MTMMTTTRWGLLLVACLLLPACGGDDDDGTPDTDGGPGAVDAANAGADAGTGADAGGGGGGDTLHALAAGRTWTYDVVAVGVGSVCAPGTHTEDVVSETQIGGRDAFEVSSWCGAAGTSYLAVDGDKVELYYGGGWIVTLDTPVEEGHTWTSTGPISYTWHRETSVTVPAGTFDDCWRREQNVSYTAYTIYCRGVGAVRDYSEDLAGNGWDARLASR